MALYVLYNGYTMAICQINLAHLSGAALNRPRLRPGGPGPRWRRRRRLGHQRGAGRHVSARCGDLGMDQGTMDRHP